MTQTRIASMSNAGGTGKSTMVINLAYQLARKGKTICIMGCDPNGSLTLFAGLDDPPDASQTLDRVLRKDFDGSWPLFPVWRDRIDGIDACLGGLVLTETAKRLDQESRGSYMLADALEDYPLTHDVVLFDCPGTIERFHEVTLTASTQVLIVTKLDDKDVDAALKLCSWIYTARKDLRIKPPPEILGLVPNGFRKDRAMHRGNMGTDPERSLPAALEALSIKLFPTIKDSAHLANAGANGLPLGIYRPGEPINQVFEKIASNIIEEN